MSTVRPIWAFLAVLAATLAPSPAPQTPQVPAPVSAAPENIYLAATNGSISGRLTRGGWPAWSPDAKKIAFHRDGQIHVIDPDGSNDRTVAAGSWPAWSPDGARIAFTSSDGISVMNADGTDIKTLIRRNFRTDTYAPSDMGVGKPAWSPDGARIAFEHLGDGDLAPAQTFVMNADGTGAHLLTALPGGRKYAESDPSWSPDGSKIVYWSYGYGIATVTVNDGVPTALYASFPGVAYGAKPVWSPDGRTVAFNTLKGTNGTTAILTMASTGGAPAVLIPDAYQAAWSPDGSRIAFVSTRAQ